MQERHRSRETIEAIRLVISILVTFTALVLGLLTSSAKIAFDDYGNRLRAYGIDIIELDQRMREYGDGVEATRAMLRAYVAAAIADTWPDEPRPTGVYPTHIKTFVPGSIEGEELSAMLGRVDNAIRSLEPADKFHQQLADLLEGADDRDPGAAMAADRDLGLHRFLAPAGPDDVMAGDDLRRIRPEFGAQSGRLCDDRDSAPCRSPRPSS